MTVDRTDPYSALGLNPNATQGQIRRAYRTLLRQNHPDTRPLGNPADDAASDTTLRQVLAAYAILGDQTGQVGDRPTEPRASIQSPSRLRAPRPRNAPDQPPIRVGPVRWHGFRR